MGVSSIRICVLAVLAAIIVLAALSAASEELTILAEEDTYTYQGATTTNYNNQGLLCKSQSGARRYSWIEYLLGSQTAQSATLNLYMTSIPSGWGSSHTIVLSAAQANIDEATLTWATHPTPTWTNMSGWTASAVGWYSADITSFYNANLGARVVFRVYQTDTNNVGGAYEDSEGSRGTTFYPYIGVAPVPEPAGVMALLAGLSGLGALIRRKA